MPIITYVREKDERVPARCWDTRFYWNVLEILPAKEDGTQEARVEIAIFDNEASDRVEVAIWFHNEIVHHHMNWYKPIFEEWKGLMSVEEMEKYTLREKEDDLYYSRMNYL